MFNQETVAYIREKFQFAGTALKASGAPVSINLEDVAFTDVHRYLSTSQRWTNGTVYGERADFFSANATGIRIRRSTKAESHNAGTLKPFWVMDNAVAQTR